MGDFFHFKEFNLYQKGAAAKIGTDAMLLGAWVKPGMAENILDIGTGTGVLALMMAQQSAAMIDAVEIDERSVEIANRNFEGSPWSFRIQLYHADFRDYAKQCTLHYNLIISNPPFFSSGFDKGYGSERRLRARSQSSLNYEELVAGVKKLLSDDGHFALIIPAEQGSGLLQLSAEYGLFPLKICRVRSFEQSADKRMLLLLSRDKQQFTNEQLVIYRQAGRYSPQYIELTKDFHHHPLQ